MKTKISIQQAIEDIRAMFNIGKNTSGEKDGEFFILKSDFERWEVIEKLTDYFRDKAVEGGGVYVSPITFGFTSVVVGDCDKLNRLTKKQ